MSKKNEETLSGQLGYFLGVGISCVFVPIAAGFGVSAFFGGSATTGFAVGIVIFILEVSKRILEKNKKKSG